MYHLLKPQIVLPVHGEKSFIREHKRFALACGINEVFSARNGDMCLLKDNHIECIEQVATDILGWDRNRPVSLGADVIRNRRRIAYNCSMYISAVIQNTELLDLQMTSVDILEKDEWQKLAETILAEVRPLIEKRLLDKPQKNSLEDYIRGQIRRRVFHATDIKPVTMLNVFYMAENES